MNWEAISAIGQILGILITFMVGCIAMLPYMRKFNIYFLLCITWIKNLHLL